MGQETIQGKTIKSLIWRFAERTGAQLVNFIVSIILARILDVEVYGTIALVTVYMTILQVFVDSGLGNALIIKKNADELDFSTVFFFNVAVCVLLYIFMFFMAPVIANFYNKQELVNIIRVLSLILIISGVKNIQQAYVSKHLLFKRFFFSTLGGTILAAVVGIYMALNGFGVWALVMQYLVNSFVDTAILWASVRWKPRWQFSFERLQQLYADGWRLLAASLLNTIYDNMRQLVIGKMYTESDLAYYNKGKQYPFLIISNINSSIDSVLFPVVSSEQDNLERVREITRRAIKESSFIIWPLMAGLAACGDNVIAVLLTEKWSSCVPYLRLFCFSYAFWPIHTANLNAIRAMGYTDVFLKLEVVKKVVDLMVLLISIKYGPLMICVGVCVVTIFNMGINAWPNRAILKYGILSQIRDILPNAILAIFMGIIVALCGLLEYPTYIILLLQIMIGIIVYIVSARLTHNESYEYIVKMIKKRKKSEK